MVESDANSGWLASELDYSTLLHTRQNFSFWEDRYRFISRSTQHQSQPDKNKEWSFYFDLQWFFKISLFTSFLLELSWRQTKLNPHVEHLSFWNNYVKMGIQFRQFNFISCLSKWKWGNFNWVLKFINSLPCTKQLCVHGKKSNGNVRDKMKVIPYSSDQRKPLFLFFFLFPVNILKDILPGQ